MAANEFVTLTKQQSDCIREHARRVRRATDKARLDNSVVRVDPALCWAYTYAPSTGRGDILVRLPDGDWGVFKPVQHGRVVVPDIALHPEQGPVLKMSHEAAKQLRSAADAEAQQSRPATELERTATELAAAVKHANGLRRALEQASSAQLVTRLEADMVELEEALRNARRTMVQDADAEASLGRVAGLVERWSAHHKELVQAKTLVPARRERLAELLADAQLTVDGLVRRMHELTDALTD